MNHRETTNYYDVLEVAPNAPQTEIHRAYQRARDTYAQDNPALYSMFTKDEARELLRIIEEAYAVLGNQALRKSYDENLLKGSQRILAMRTIEPSSLSSTQDPVSAYAASADLEHLVPDPSIPESLNKNDMISSFRGDSSFDANKRGGSLSDPATRESLGVAAAPASAGVSAVASIGASTAPLAVTPTAFTPDEAMEKEIADAVDFDGTFLQKVRTYKNVTIDRMSEVTRISRPYLMAVETNDFKQLPAAVFVRGFIVQIARQLGLNETKVAASYMKRFKAGGGK